MQDLLLHLIDERGPIRLAVELALAIGSLAVLVAWAAEGVRDRRRRRAAIEDTGDRDERRAA